MSTYSLSFKLRAVQHYLSGLEGQKATARHFGIDYACRSYGRQPTEPQNRSEADAAP